MSLEKKMNKVNDILKELSDNNDLNYQEKDKSKLLNLIENLNSHWAKYDHLKGKVSDSKILILLVIGQLIIIHGKTRGGMHRAQR